MTSDARDHGAAGQGLGETAGFPDGTVLDVVVVDAERTDDGSEVEVVIEVAIATGDRKGELLAIRAPGLDLDPLDLLGLVATITVVDGEPRLSL